jgi:hypothetical protein
MVPSGCLYLWHNHAETQQGVTYGDTPLDHQNFSGCNWTLNFVLVLTKACLLHVLKIIQVEQHVTGTVIVTVI